MGISGAQRKPRLRGLHYIAVSLGSCFLAWVLSPWFALWHLDRVIQRGDVHTFGQYVDESSIRRAGKRQLDLERQKSSGLNAQEVASRELFFALVEQSLSARFLGAYWHGLRAQTGRGVLFRLGEGRYMSPNRFVVHMRTSVGATEPQGVVLQRMGVFAWEITEIKLGLAAPRLPGVHPGKPIPAPTPPEG